MAGIRARRNRNGGGQRRGQRDAGTDYIHDHRITGARDMNDMAAAQAQRFDALGVGTFSYIHNHDTRAGGASAERHGMHRHIGFCGVHLYDMFNMPNIRFVQSLFIAGWTNGEGQVKCATSF